LFVPPSSKIPKIEYPGVIELPAASKPNRTMLFLYVALPAIGTIPAKALLRSVEVIESE
jgi:hypothetical protein